MNMQPPSKKRLLDYVGWLLVSVALAFLARKFWLYRGDLAEWRPDKLAVSFMIAGAAVYAGAFVLGALGWARMVQYWDPTADAWRIFRLYARTQIAKYIPGNVFHVAGRWAGGRRMGLSHRAILGATLYEIGISLVVSLFFAAFWFAGKAVPGPACRAASVAGLLAGLVLFPFVAVKIAGRLVPLLHIDSWPIQTRLSSRRGLVPAYYAYALLFAIIGAIFVAWARLLTGTTGLERSAFFFSAFAAAWLIGFVAPGASGGLGVREAVLVGLLGSSVGDAQALAMAIGFRIITVAGDVLVFALSFLAPGHDSASGASP